MISPRFIPLAFAVLMSLYMVTGMTFVITWVNTGLDQGFMDRWLRAFVIAYPIAFTLVWVGGPKIRQWVENLAKREAIRQT